MRTSSVTELHPIHRVTQPAVRPGVLAIYRLHRRGAGATAIVAWRRAQLAHGRSFPEVAP